MEKRCELYLRLRASQAPSDAELERIAREIKPAALLLTGIERTPHDGVRRIVGAAQRQNLAILLEDQIELAQALDADGVHIGADGERLGEARRLLGDHKSIGVSCGLSRHEAMVFAEAGADYLAFSENMAAGAYDDDGAAAMIRWWAELFEVPCVAWLGEEARTDDGRRLIEAGADYLAVALQVSDKSIDMDHIREFAALTGDMANSV